LLDLLNDSALLTFVSAFVDQRARQCRAGFGDSASAGEKFFSGSAFRAAGGPAHALAG
jgi:hypothetical protein